MPEALITKVQTERMANAQRVVLPSGATTWTVLGSDLLPAEPVEQVLEYMRVRRQSPKTVKAYARGLQLWWRFLDLHGLDWRAAQLEDFGRFLGWLRSGNKPAVASIVEREPRLPSARSRCGCTPLRPSIALTTSTASASPRSSTSACSPPAAATSPSSSTSPAATARVAA